VKNPTPVVEQELLQDAVEANYRATAALMEFMQRRERDASTEWHGSATELSVRKITDGERVPIFAQPLLLTTQRLVKELFGAKLLWMSVALDQDARSLAKTKQTLGLRRMLLLHSGNASEAFTFKTSFTRVFLERTIGSAAEHNSTTLGLLVTETAPSGTVEPSLPALVTVHTDNDAFVDGPSFDVRYAECLPEVNDQLPGPGKWRRYIDDFADLVGRAETIRAHMSITSTYHLEGFHAASQLIVGLDTAPRTLASVRAFFHLMQVTAAGIAPVYASIGHEQRQRRQDRDRVLHLETPLTKLSESLATVQLEVQALRGILYEPARELFATHQKVASMFVEGTDFPLSNHLTIELRHKAREAYNQPDYLAEGRAVLAMTLCRILGRESADELKNTKTCPEFIEAAMKVLEGPFEMGSRTIRRAELLWLCGHSEASFTHVLQDPTPGKVLGRIKTALVDPFKAHATRWYVLPFVLAGRSFAADPAKLSVNLERKVDFTGFANPASANHLLELFMGVAAAAKSQSARVTDILFEQETTTIAIAWKFAGRLVSDTAEARALADELRRFVLRTPRDWRVSHEIAGDFRKPFVDLATRLLGLGAGPDEWNVLESPDEPGRFTPIRLRHRARATLFSVEVTGMDDVDSALIATWTREEQPPTRPRKTKDNAEIPNAIPNAAANGIALLDHQLAESGESAWFSALRLANLRPVIRERSIAPDEFAIDFPAFDGMVFLHADSAVERSAWNEHVRTGRFLGHLIHVSVGGPSEMSQHTPPHDRIHACVLTPSAFANGPGLEFAAGVESGKPQWQLIARLADMTDRRNRMPTIRVRGILIIGDGQARSGSSGHSDLATMLKESFGAAIPIFFWTERGPAVAPQTLQEVDTVILLLSGREKALTTLLADVRDDLARLTTETALVRWVILTQDPAAVRALEVGRASVGTALTFADVERTSRYLRIVDTSKIEDLTKLLQDPDFHAEPLPQIAVDTETHEVAACLRVLRSEDVSVSSFVACKRRLDELATRLDPVVGHTQANEIRRLLAAVTDDVTPHRVGELVQHLRSIA